METYTDEQRAVVECRLSVGYQFIEMVGKSVKLCKGRHIMQINVLGYDEYVGRTL